MTGRKDETVRAGANPAGEGDRAPERFEERRRCTVCGVLLSAYNHGPHCWRHSAGVPWRGPSARPKLD